MSTPRDQANHFAYKCILPFQISYMNCMLDHGGGGGAIKTNDDANQINYLNSFILVKSNRKAMNRNWSNQKANPALKSKAGYKLILQ